MQTPARSWEQYRRLVNFYIALECANGRELHQGMLYIYYTQTPYIKHSFTIVIYVIMLHSSQESTGMVTRVCFNAAISTQEISGELIYKPRVDTIDVADTFPSSTLVRALIR